jgi:ribosomal protein S2
MGSLRLRKKRKVKKKKKTIFSLKKTASDIVVPFLKRQSNYLMLSKFIPGLLTDIVLEINMY